MKSAIVSRARDDRRLRILLQAALIVGAGWFAYEPVFRGARVWDDRIDFPEERLALDLSGLAKVWSGALDHDYYPIKATVQWVQWRLWGDEMLGYHLTNVGLHLLGALILWRLLGKLGVRHAWLGGLLFTVHPLAVESVAWWSELKNVLSLPPLLLAMCAWVDWDVAETARFSPRLDNPRSHERGYVVSILWFVAAMLCKSSVVMFPCVLLLYAWWRRGRIRLADLRRIAPFFGISLILGLVEVAYQHKAIGGTDLGAGSALSRMVTAGLAAIFYFCKGILPVDLVPVYPRWTVDPPSLVPFLPWIGLGALSGWLWRRYSGGGEWARHALFGLGFFLVDLFPVLGFLPMSYQLTSWVADRFAYLPLAGLVGLAAVALPNGERAKPLGRWVASVAVAGVVAALAFASHRHAAVFASEEALWTYTVQHNPKAWLAQNNLGNALGAAGRVPEAMARYGEALRLRPNFAEAHNNLGFGLVKSGRVPEAMAEYREALRLKPDYAVAHNNLGHILVMTGHLPEAIAQFEEALRLNPDYAEADNNLGIALEHEGRQADGIRHLEHAIRLVPRYAEAHDNLANALADAGRVPEALAHYQEALRLRPNYAQAHIDLAVVLAGLGKSRDAVVHYQEALRLQPDFPEAENGLGLALAQTGSLQGAIAHYGRALALKPDYPEAEYNLGNALFAQGRLPDAIAQYRKAVQLKPDYTQAHNNLGVALQSAGLLSEAVQEYRQTLRLNPNDPQSQVNLGIALASISMNREAVEHFRRALELSPNLAEAHYHLGLLLEGSGDIAGARAQYTLALKLRPDYADARVAIGRVQTRNR